MAALGPRRGRCDLWRLLWVELRTGLRWIRRHAAGAVASDSHVRRIVPLHRGDGRSLASYRRGLLFCAYGNGSLGRLHHGPRGEHGIHSDTGRDRRRNRRLSGRDLRNAKRVRASVVAGLLRNICFAEHLGRRTQLPLLGGHHDCGTGGSRDLLGIGCSTV